MKHAVKVLGFYKRERDGNEYVLYEENGKKYLTNGAYIWRDRVEARYLPQCRKVEKVDLKKIIGRLEKAYPYSPVLSALKLFLDA